MIYFMQPTDGGPVKIGRTVDVDRRIVELEAHYGCDLAVLATMEGGRDEERAIHARFAQLRLGRTEQFRPDAELMAFIGRPLLVGANPDAVEAIPPKNAITIINLKGSRAQDDWLEDVHRKTHIAKSVIVRLALAHWAEHNGHPPFPAADDDQ